MVDSDRKNKDTRPSWDEYYMTFAVAAASRSTCPRRATGAVIVQDNRVIATGYNGAPRGAEHCPTQDKAGHPDCMEHGHCVRAVHAEINAIIACASGGASTRGAELYCTTFPCHRCIGPVINAGIVRIVYLEVYKDATHAKNYHEVSMRLALDAGLFVTGMIVKDDSSHLWMREKYGYPGMEQDAAESIKEWGFGADKQPPAPVRLPVVDGE